MARIRVPLAEFNADSSEAIAKHGKGNNPLGFLYNTLGSQNRHFVELDFGGPLEGVVSALPDDYIGASPDPEKVKRVGAEKAKANAAVAAKLVKQAKAEAAAAAAKAQAEAAAAEAAEEAADEEEDGEDAIDYVDIVAGTIDEVKQAVADLELDSAAMKALIKAEKKNANRSTLIAYLEAL